MPRRTRGALIALLLAVAGPGGSTPLEFADVGHSHVWRMPDPDFGGFSGLWVAPDGAGFIAIGDRGAVATGRLVRDGRGRIAGVADAALGRLRDPLGRPLTERATDAEGLAVAPDGTIFVAFELQHRVVRLAAPEAPALTLPALPEAEQMHLNTGIEALAFDRDGRLLAIPEAPPRGRTDFPVWRLDGRFWTLAHSLRFEAPWRIVAADLGPDGALYVLERDLRLPYGFRSRIRRFALEGDGIEEGETLWQTRPGQYGNLEGLSLWTDEAGRLRATMISDDNFLPVLSTAFVELVLAPAPARR
jgi:hypothetical protein